MASSTQGANEESPPAQGSKDTEAQQEELRFSPDEEAELLRESEERKQQGNQLFRTARYSEAIQQYDTGLSSCPDYLDYEVAVLRSNIAACHIKLEDWKSAIQAADASLEALDRVKHKDRESVEANGKRADGAGDDEEQEGEDIISPGAERIGPRPTPREEKGPSEEDILRMRAKVLMRRAHARTQSGGWSALVGAEEDYKTLSAMSNLPAQDRKTVTQQLRTLPARIEAAKQKEMGEMMGKLKELGNGLLKPFGLSTDNFNMVKDESTGGYNIQFDQGRGAGSR